MIRSRAVPTNGLSPVYDETGAASARFLLWLREETRGAEGRRVAGSGYAHHERCTLELVEDVVERLAALGWITVHNDSGAVPRSTIQWATSDPSVSASTDGTSAEFTRRLGPAAIVRGSDQPALVRSTNFSEAPTCEDSSQLRSTRPCAEVNRGAEPVNVWPG